MITRRQFAGAALTAPLVITASSSISQEVELVIGENEEFFELDFPSIDALDGTTVFGYRVPNKMQKEKAERIISSAKKGPTPFAIALDFIDKYYDSDPMAISQWPKPDAWNPVVRSFFSATSLRAENDMIAWCAAFANWCIVRNGRKGTNSAASQSFVTSNMFKRTSSPKQGDLVVFTCYEKSTGRNLGLGHVGFFEADRGNDRISVVGGNQSADGHSSIISRRLYKTTPFDVRRRVDGIYVPCIYKLNTFLEL